MLYRRYVCGIIQEGNWTSRGKHLENKNPAGTQWMMVIGMVESGDWTYEGMQENTEKPRMYGRLGTELIRHLEIRWLCRSSTAADDFDQDKSIVMDLEKLDFQRMNGKKSCTLTLEIIRLNVWPLLKKEDKKKESTS